jgi:hypothetical protein
MVVEAAIRSPALPDRRAVWPVLAPVTIDGIGTAVPAHEVDGDEVLRLITQVWPRLERRVSLFTEELSGTHRFLVRPIEEALLALTPGDQAARYAAEATPLAIAAAERAIVATRYPAHAVHELRMRRGCGGTDLGVRLGALASRGIGAGGRGGGAVAHVPTGRHVR